MYNRRNSLQRSSSKRYSQGLSPAAAAAMVSFSQQNPRQNSTVLAANAAAEALRRHSLDAEGAAAVANFGRRGSITSQSGDRRNSLQRRNSITQSQRVSSRDQYGRAMSLTTTTVRQMGSFEIVKQQTTPVRPPRAPRAPESIYSLESLREEPEQQHAAQGHPGHPGPRKTPKNRVSFQADTSEFHYDSYGYEEPNALAAAAAVGGRRAQSLQPPPRQARQSASPMKSALKKPFESEYSEQYEQYDQYEHGPAQYNEHEEYEDNSHPEEYNEEHHSQAQSPQNYARFEEPEQEQTHEDEREFVTRPLSAVSEFSTVTAKEDFTDSDGSPVQPVEPVERDESVSDLEEYEREFVPQGQVAPEVAQAEVVDGAQKGAQEGTVQVEAPTATPSETPAPLRNLPPPMSAAEVSPVTQSPSSSPRERVPSVRGSLPKAITRNGANGSASHVTHATQASAAGAAARALGQPARRQGSNGAPPPHGASRAPNGLRGPPPHGPAPHRPPPGMVQGHPQQAPHPQHAHRSQPQIQQSSYRALQQRQQQQQQQRTAPAPGRANSLTYRDSYSAPRRTLQPSPSIDGFNRISNTSDIIEQAKARARAYVQEQPQTGAAFSAPLTLSQDDAASISSDSSWKRERAARKQAGPGRFRGREARSSVDRAEHSPASRSSGAPVGAVGASAPGSVGSALTGPALGHGRRSSTASSFAGPPSGSGRTYSLRGQAPPDISRKWRSRFEDSDDEEATQHKPSLLPKLVDSPSKPKKKGFFKRLFSGK